MAINGINGIDPAYAGNVQQQSNTSSSAKPQAETTVKEDQQAAVYEKAGKAVATEVKGKTSKMDTAKIEQMLKEAETKKQAFRDMIQKMFTKQGEAVSMATSGLANFYRSLDVPPEVSEQARKDIADDGYWGVEQTSDRILSFAQAIAGNDKEMATKMLDAVKEGFRQATHDWGEDLPDISQRTMTASIDKLNAWIDSLGQSDKPAEPTA